MLSIPHPVSKKPPNEHFLKFFQKNSGCRNTTAPLCVLTHAFVTRTAPSTSGSPLRHPTLGDNIVVGSGAKVLGNITIGSNSRIGAGSVVIDDVPENSTVTGIPGRIVRQKLLIQGQLMHNRIPDPVTCQLNRLKYEVEDLKEKIEELKKGGN